MAMNTDFQGLDLAAGVWPQNPVEVVLSDRVKARLRKGEQRTGLGEGPPLKVVRIFDGDQLVSLTKEPLKSS